MRGGRGPQGPQLAPFSDPCVKRTPWQMVLLGLDPGLS